MVIAALPMCGKDRNLARDTPVAVPVTPISGRDRVKRQQTGRRSFAGEMPPVVPNYRRDATCRVTPA